MDYSQETIQKVAETVGVNPSQGLSSREVAGRLERYGFNVLEEKKHLNPLVLFINQFRNFIIYILLFAVAISVISGEYADATVILVILVCNAFFGFIQEYKAEKSIAALQKLSSQKANVLRNGKQLQVESRELVPGDVIFLEEGTKIPADARLIEAISLKVSEASLTGESNPVSKTIDALKGEKPLAERICMIYSGTIVTKGRGTALVTETGMQTQIGKIAEMVTSVEQEMTPLQKKLEDLGGKIGIGTIFICVIIFLVGITKEGDWKLLLAGQFVNFIFAAKTWFLTAVSLAVAAVPEGLPAIVTITLAIGVRQMLHRNALIRKLPSVETLGETTVICSDKTGTLTKNEMTVKLGFTNGKQLKITGEGYDPKGTVSSSKGFNENDRWLFHIGVLCNDAQYDPAKSSIQGDPTEASLLVSAQKTGLDVQKVRSFWQRLGEEPFDSVRKMMSTVNRDPESKKSFVFVKGAPEAILSRCDRIRLGEQIKKLDTKTKKSILCQNDAFAKEAYRVLAFAYKEFDGEKKQEENLIFVGLQGMIDPPHTEVPLAVKKCYEAGIRVVMITGDNKLTAESIAHQIGIKGTGMNGADFAKLSKKEQLEALERVSIFARVEPAHKMKIVDLLQSQGEVVAMTGDGVNDAPALKKADIGIAMGITGTDVAKEASQMVLLDDNFTSIVNAIEEGRGIYVNIRKFVNYLISCNLAEVLIIFLAILFQLPLPMTAIMLLWLNLVTDGLPALALAVDPRPANVMQRPPIKSSEGIMNKQILFVFFGVSILITLGVLGAFVWSLYESNWTDIERAQTIAFTTLVAMELFRLQLIRQKYNLTIWSNKYLLFALASSLGLQLIVIYSPIRQWFGTVKLSLFEWGVILIATLSMAVLSLVGERVLIWLRAVRVKH